MPWNDNSNPGPWNSPSGEVPPPKETADKGSRQGGAPNAGASDSGRPETDGRGAPWRDARRLGPDRPPRDRPTEAPRQRRSGAPPPRGPDLEELSRLLKARLTQALGQGGRVRLSPALAGAAALAIVGVWALSGLYRVQPGQQAVLTRFGAYAGVTGPGLNYHLPFPIGNVRKVSVSTINRLDIGGSGGLTTPSESQMLTRDGNLADVDYTVQWRVSDPAAYLFHLSDPDAVMKLAAETAMRQAVGQATFADVIAARAQVQARAATLLQASLDRAGAGMSVVDLQVRDAEPPQAAAPAYRDLAAARQDAETAVGEAEAYRTRVLAEAKSEAVRSVQAAQGYRDQVEREAAGEAARFALIDAQYRRAPAVTRQRLYIETMEHVLRASNKVVLDAKGRSTVALPPELFRLHATPDANPAGRTSGSAPPAQAVPPPPGQAAAQAQPRTDGNTQ